MNHPKVTTIAEALRLAAKIAEEATIKKPIISDAWFKEAQSDPAEAIAYTHADRIAEELTALAEEYENG